MAATVNDGFLTIEGLIEDDSETVSIGISELASIQVLTNATTAASVCKYHGSHQATFDERSAAGAQGLTNGFADNLTTGTEDGFTDNSSSIEPHFGLRKDSIHIKDVYPIS